MKKINENLLSFLDKCPSTFHAVYEMKKILLENGYEELLECDKWLLKKGGKYFTTRNESSIIAFNISDNLNDYYFKISATHSDSPTYKIKETADLENDGYIKLNVEGYGGMLASTWFDKPLSLAGRVLIEEDGKIVSKLVNIDKDILMLPNLAIHMNREANNGYKYNTQIDMLPMFSAGKASKDEFYDMIAENAGTSSENVLAHDLFLYNRMESKQWGYKDEFISAPKLDNLECAFATLSAMVDSECNNGINVVCSFDNEEVGSATKQGAGSTFLKDVLRRINDSLGFNDDDYCQAVSKSFMMSCDNAHAVHPNYAAKSDVKNRCYLNKGVVIKYSANQKYTTDAISSAIVKMIAKKSGVNIQEFINRSDMIGGSTLGNISNSQVSLHAADIGVAQLAMHSSYETAGSEDVEAMYKLINYFYNNEIKILGNNLFEVE